MIQIEGLSKKYRGDKWALRDINLTFDEGMIGLLGPNGAGKSTLMRIMATLSSPTTGSGMIEGIPLSQAEDIRKMIGYLPQQFQVYPQITGEEYLDYVAVMKGIKDSKQRKLEIAKLLEQVNLVDKAKHKVKTYSGGMKRRLGIAQALLGSPPVLIVDEPTAGLDPEERVRFRNLLTRFSIGRVVLLSTHIVADIESNCRQAAVLDRGQVLFSGDLRELQQYGTGKVWEVILSDEQFAMLDPMSVISTRRQDEGMLCRVIGAPPSGITVTQAAPTLEDGYLALLRDQGGVLDA